MKLDLRRWLIVVLAAGLPVPYAFHLPGESASYVAVDLLVWPVLAGAPILLGVKEWGGFRHDRVARLLVAFVAVSAISVPFGVIVYHGLGGARSFAYEVAILLNFVVGYFVLRNIDDIGLLIKAFVASIGTIAVLLSLYLLLTGAAGDVHIVHNSPALRSFVYGWPNGFAVLLAVGIVMCLYVISTTSSSIARGIYIVFGIGLAACIILTFSKTGWVALLVALWLLFLRFWRLRYQALLLAAIVLSIAIISALNQSFRISIFQLNTFTERILFLVVVLRNVNPLALIAGSGSQTVETLLASHANEQLIPGVTVGSLSTHDEFLDVLVKTGVVGLMIFVATLALVLMRARRVAVSADDRTSRLFRYWYAAGWAVIVSLFAGEELHYWLISALFWMMAGATIHVLPVSDPQRAVVVTQRPSHPVKRILDLTVGLVALIVSSPVLLVASIFAKLDSPGPAFYRGDRVGRGGWIFSMYKLRTMRVGAEGSGSVTVAGDPRVTRVGRVLRKLKLDELPQLINVVSGDMSLVGPRPDTAEYARLYNERQLGVLSVRPGLTSPASIAFQNEEELLLAAAADRGCSPNEIYREVIMPKELELDLEYVEQWSVWRDFRILAQTAGLLLRRLLGLPSDLRHAGGGRLAPPQAEVDQPLNETDTVTDVVADEGGRQNR